MRSSKIFILANPSSRTTALKWIPEEISGAKARSARKPYNITAMYELIV
jgi:hypothetical protein